MFGLWLPHFLRTFFVSDCDIAVTSEVSDNNFYVTSGVIDCD